MNGNYELAYKEFKNAVDADDRNCVAQFQLVGLFLKFNLGSLDEAMKSMKLCIAYDSDIRGLIYYSTLCRLQEGWPIDRSSMGYTAYVDNSRSTPEYYMELKLKFIKEFGR